MEALSIAAGYAPVETLVLSGDHDTNVGSRATPQTPQENPAVSATPRKARRSRNTLRLWTFEQAQAVVPYVASIVRSLREYAIQMQNLRRRLTTMEDQPGRPDRRALIALEETKRDLNHAEQDNAAAREELETLDIQLLDAAKGQALVPFVHDDQLAWYVFDLFDSQPIRAWRFQSDPEETRRKLTAAQMR
jgi:hypothetical protein